MVVRSKNTTNKTRLTETETEGAVPAGRAWEGEGELLFCAKFTQWQIIPRIRNYVYLVKCKNTKLLHLEVI